MEDKNQDGDNWLHCSDCGSWLNEEQQATMCCGWLPKHKRIGSPPAPWVRARGGGPEPTVCPGYTISLPQVQQTARALQWAERGLLSEYCGTEDLPQLVFDAVDILNAEISAVERFALREIKNKRHGAH